MVDDVVVGFEDAVRQPIVAQELPDVLGRVEFRAFGRQGQDGDVGRNVEFAGRMSACLIEDENGVASGRDILGDFREMEVHGEGVALGQDERAAPLPSFGQMAPKM